MGTCCKGFGKHWIIFSFMQRFEWLPQGRPQGKQKMKAGVRKNGDFYRAMLCIGAVYAGTRYRSVCLSVRLSRSWIMSKRINISSKSLYFDAEYLINGYRYGHSYYGRQIGKRIQAFKWHQFQWPWVTSKPAFKVTILFNVKRLENGTR